MAAAISLTGFAARADNAVPILGKWVITSYQLAPWSRAQDAPRLNADAKKLLKLQVTYTANAVVAKDRTIGCTKAHYEPSSFPYTDLFQGALGIPHTGPGLADGRPSGSDSGPWHRPL